MTTNAPAKYSEQTFESIKHVNEYGEEYWLARELQPVLEYTQWRRFADVIERAKLACRNSGYNVEDHFADVGKTIEMPKNAHKIVPDYMLSRYACYLIVMNGDPRKEIIAVGQTYFAVKARQQELIERYDALTEDQKRLAIRSEMIAHNKSLAQAAKQARRGNAAGLCDLPEQGLSGPVRRAWGQRDPCPQGSGEKPEDTRPLGSTELAANLFRATQTDEKLRRDEVSGKQAAYDTHYEVGRKVRQTIRELGGTMPEDLPTPEKSIAQIEREQDKLNLKTGGKGKK